MKTTQLLFAFLLLAITAPARAQPQILDIECVTVGYPDNAPDYTSFGAVDYVYYMGKYEVTAGQYVAFLNDVDPIGANSDDLYNSSMDSTYGCQITLNGSDYDFSGAPSGTASDWENRPVNYISWYDAAMFANWLTSGDIHQGAYDTSVDAGWGDFNASNYTGATPHDSAEMDALVGNYGKVWVIPTEDERYKAAYHKNDGDTGNYFDYPTSSDSEPGYVTDSGYLSGTGIPFIDGVIDPGNYATYEGDEEEITPGIGPDYYRTEVGEWENSGSPYGTFDQGGNVWEWNEEILYGSYRGIRGSSFNDDGGDGLHASSRNFRFPTNEGSYLGFRVASIPEPNTALLAIMGALALLGIARRKRR